MNGRKETINLKLYDIQDRLYKKYTEKELLQDWPISTNQKFFQHEISEAQAWGYSKIIVGNAGNAQDRIAYSDASSDTHNAARITMLPIIQSYFSKQLKCEVTLDPFWMADIYAGEQAGESYKAALKEIFQASRNEHHTQAVQDPSQILTLYVLAHRVSTLNPDVKEIVIDYYHDTVQHLTALYLFFDHHQLLLPRNVFLRLRHYDENKISTYLQVNIQGTGTLDPHYDWSARYIESQYHHSIDRQANQRNIHTANDLATYHFEGSYNAPGRKISLDINLETFQVEKFLNFRSKEIQTNPNLASLCLLGTESKYTTATKLHQAGLIPGKFVLDSGSNKNPAPVAQEPRKADAEPKQPAPAPEPIKMEPKQPAPSALKTSRNMPAKETLSEANQGTSPAYPFLFEERKFVPESPLVITAPPKSAVNILIENDSLSPPTLPSRIEDTAPVLVARDSKKFVLGVIESPGPNYAKPPISGSNNDDLIISPDDVYSSIPTDNNNHHDNPKVEIPVYKPLNESRSDSDSDALSHSEETATATLPAQGSMLTKRQNNNGDNILEYLQNLYSTFENPKKNLSMTNYIKTLRNALQVHHLPIPNEFNALHALKNIARLPCWQTQGNSLTYFWGKVPDAISEVIRNDPAKLDDLVKLVRDSIESRSSSYFHGKRTPMTSDFYELILMMCEKHMDDQIRFLAINAFCTKWKISDSVMEVDIAPEFVFRAQV